jgi:hypothetical protein
MGALEIAAADLAGLEESPPKPVPVRLGNSQGRARIAIPDYAANLEHHYGQPPASTGIEFGFHHFGLLIDFDKPSELAPYDDRWRLAAPLRELVSRFGPVALSNVHLPAARRNEGQRNIFPSLDFHFDRGPAQDNQYSLFVRDPFDDIQRAPRRSSTLVIANAVAWLQHHREGASPPPYRSLHHLFAGEVIEALAGSVLLDLSWSAPEGTGEIALLDNRSVLHASYYNGAKGYPIGVRYLF